jgi:predicted histone-like DNA-binding protein
MVSKKNNLVSPPQTKYYPYAVNNGADGLDSLADIVASQSTISKADCCGVIMALTKVIGESLSDGSIVRIDSLGSFQITVQGLPGESPDELGKATIKGANIIYKPSKNMKNMLNGLIYKRTR